MSKSIYHFQGNSQDHDQTAPQEQSDQGLHCLQCKPKPKMLLYSSLIWFYTISKYNSFIFSRLKVKRSNQDKVSPLLKSVTLKFGIDLVYFKLLLHLQPFFLFLFFFFFFFFFFLLLPCSPWKQTYLKRKLL